MNGHVFYMKCLSHMYCCYCCFLLLEEGFGFENTEYTVGESCGKLDVTIVRTGAVGGFGTVLRKWTHTYVGNTHYVGQPEILIYDLQ